MRIKGWLITAGVLLLLGIAFLGGAFTVAKWDLTRLSAKKYETNAYEITEAYRNVRVIGNTADVTFVPSADGTTAVHCYEDATMRHAVSVTNDTLTVEVNDTRKWYEYVGITFGTPRITVYLPQGAYDTLTVETDTGNIAVPAAFAFDSVSVTGHTGNVTYAAPATGNVTLKTTTGHIKVQNVTANGLSLTVSTGSVFVAGTECQGGVAVNVSTGKTHLSVVSCQNLTSDGSTGDMFLEGVTVRDRLTVERDTGDVSFDLCDAAELFIATTTGDVKGSLLSEKVFLTSTDTGRVDVPKTTVGGRCEIITDTGDIKITVTH